MNSDSRRLIPHFRPQLCVCREHVISFDAGHQSCLDRMIESIPMTDSKIADPGFWLALGVGIMCVVCFVYWLITGARKQG